MLLSIIITTYNEGILIHKAILSVIASLSFADIEDYEILLHIDNGTSETEEYINSSAFNFKNVRIYRNNFGDSGESRNFCVKKSSGKYVFILDSDDLISENFFKVALDILEKNSNSLVHPESCLSFDNAGEYRSLWTMTSSISKESDAFILLEKNRWISSVIGEKEIFEKHPYQKTCSGYGNEDYAFNTDTIDSKIKHLVAPGTVHFYRKTSSSLLTKANAKGLAQRKSDLFDISYWKGLALSGSKKELSSNNIQKHTTIKSRARHLYIKSRNNKILNTFITPMATIAKKVTGVKLIKPPQLPDDIYHQWKIISHIEPQLYPTKSSIKNLDRYCSETNNLASNAYLKLCKEATINRADYIFIVPWITIGGADKVLINYLSALKEIHSDWKIAVITTLPSKNEWKSKVSNNTCVFDFGNLATDLFDDNERDILFTRLVVQLGAKKIHIINSEFAYNWVYNHIPLISSEYDLRLSLFCHDIIPDTKGEGIFDYADPYASRIEPYVKHIFTDNNAVIDRLVSTYGFRRDIIKTHFQPLAGDVSPIKNTVKSKKMNILWASRICTQKKPELVIEIAKHLDPNKYHIDMYGKMDSQYEKKMFSNINSLTYRGSFNGLKSINAAQYDCFLYTSYVDGLPNTILEVASMGLPIVASDAGGIKDFIKNKKTGILVSDKEASAYVKALEYLRNNPEVSGEFALNAIKLLEERHSWDSFVKAVEKDF